MKDGSFYEGEDSERRLVLVGGFLGAGKTTLIGCFVNWLQSKGLRPGLITNDQGVGLIDTQSAERLRAVVAEVTGGCFCCKLDELVGALEEMEGGEEGPDVFVAEPVGSCTDLMATVLLPIEQIYQKPLLPSPLSVVLDGRRALAVLAGRRDQRSFHRDVGYVYRKQMEEAEWLVINKADLIQNADLEELMNCVKRMYPAKRVFVVSGKSGHGVEDWFEALMKTRSAPENLMEVDYQRYGEGEAKLGWLNSEIQCRKSADGGVVWEEWLGEIGGRIAEGLREAGCVVAHFKMSLTVENRRWRVHQVMEGEELVVVQEGGTADGEDGNLLINLRAEGAPDVLERIVEAELRGGESVEVSFIGQAAFRPGQPRPTHRVLAV